MKNALLAQEFTKREIDDKVAASGPELKKFYDEHKDDYTSPAQIKARHILIKVPAGADEKAWDEAKKKAEDVKKRIEKGEDFGKVAKEISDDPGTKGRGGELGYFSKGRMVPEFETAAFSLKPGTLSDPVKTIFGYHIIQVEDKKTAKARAFEDVKGSIEQRVRQENRSKRVDAVMAELKKKYPVTENRDLLSEIKVEPPKGMHGGPHGGGMHGGPHGGMGGGAAGAGSGGGGCPRSK